MAFWVGEGGEKEELELNFCRKLLMDGKLGGGQDRRRKGEVAVCFWERNVVV